MMGKADSMAMEIVVWYAFREYWPTSFRATEAH